MSNSRPRRANANTHPGDRHKALDTPRRSSAQVKADNAEKEVKREEEKSKRQAAIARIADIERRIAAQDAERAFLRPDAQVGVGKDVPSDDESDTGVEHPTAHDNYHPSPSPDHDLPPESTMDSASDGYAVGEESDDADQEDDPDYVVESVQESDSDAERLEAVAKRIAREVEADERSAGGAGDDGPVAGGQPEIGGSGSGVMEELADELEEFRRWKANEAARNAEKTAAKAKEEVKRAKAEKKKVSNCCNDLVVLFTYSHFLRSNHSSRRHL